MLQTDFAQKIKKLFVELNWVIVSFVVLHGCDELRIIWKETYPEDTTEGLRLELKGHPLHLGKVASSLLHYGSRSI